MPLYQSWFKSPFKYIFLSCFLIWFQDLLKLVSSCSLMPSHIILSTKKKYLTNKRMWIPNEKPLYKVSAVSKSWYTFLFLTPMINSLSYPFLYFWLSHSLYHSHLSLPHRNSSQSHFPGIHVSRIILCFLVFSSFFFNIFIFSSETFSTHPYVALFCACVKTTQPHSEPFFHRIISGNITASKNMKNSNPRKDICQKQQIIYLGMIVKKKN